MALSRRSLITKTGISTTQVFDMGGISISSGDFNLGSNIKLGNASGIITATTFVGNFTGNPTGSGANLTNLPAGQLTGTVADARISALTASKLTGALPAISGANLTSLPAQVTIANNADNRVITGGSGVNLNGESNVVIDANGRLGIGIASPDQELHVKGTGTVATFEGTGGSGFIALKDSDDSTVAFIGTDAGKLKFQTSGSSYSDKLVIDSSGRLLVGTTTEGVGGADELTIATSGDTGMTIRSGTSSAGGLYFSDGTSGADEYRGVVSYNHSGNYMRFYADGSERLRIASDGSCYFGPQIITEADMNWGHDAHQRPFVFSGNQAGTNPADATIVVANPNTDPSATRLGSFMFGCKTSSGGNSGVKAYIEGWTTSNPSNAHEAGGFVKFVTRQSGGSLTENFKIDHDGKLYKSGNHFYPLVNYTEVASFTAASVSSNSWTDLRTILSSYSPKKAGNLIVIHHQSQCWQGGHANSGGDAMWKIQRQEGGGSWTDTILNERIMGNMDGSGYTGGSGLARHHRTVHLMGSFTCAGTSINLKTQGKVDFTTVGLQWYHHSQNILQVWEYEKG